MNIAYFDCFNGCGGDMIVGALVDAGADPDALCEQLLSLGVDGYELALDRVERKGFTATQFRGKLDDSHEQPHRHLGDVLAIISAGSIPDEAKRRATRVFERLAAAEARVHGTSIEKVHFHEVGAVDAICDVVGAVLALDLLGIERLICSPIPTGSGTVTCEHGVIPVPAPATVELLRGVPIVPGMQTGELTTPTAAAILTTLASEFGPVPPMRVGATGYGAGTRETGEVANVLRVIVGEADAVGDADRVTVLETNLDDVTPEVIGHCIDRLWGEGALDVYTQPIHMKKSRPGTMLTALCHPANADALLRIIFAETTTFGIRRHEVDRVKLVRRHETVSTPYGEIRIKIGVRKSGTTASPEYEDCRAAARKHRVALREVMAVAGRVWSEQANESGDGAGT